MPSAPKPPRPLFFDDPASDRLTAIITALTTEVAVLQDRLITLETLLVQKGVLDAGAADGFEPDADAMAERRARHAAFTERVFYVLQEEVDSLKAQAGT